MKSDQGRKAPASTLAPDADDHERTPTVGAAIRARLNALTEGAEPPPQVEAAVDEMVREYRAFSSEERHAAVAAVVSILTLALPWRWTEMTGDTIGFLSGGLPLLLASTMVLVALYQRRTPGVRERQDQLLQALFILSTMALVFTLVLWATAHEEILLRSGGRRLPKVVADAQFGIYLGMIASAGLVVTTGKLFVDRKRLPA